MNSQELCTATPAAPAPRPGPERRRRPPESSWTPARVVALSILAVAAAALPAADAGLRPEAGPGPARRAAAPAAAPVPLAPAASAAAPTAVAPAASAAAPAGAAASAERSAGMGEWSQVIHFSPAVVAIHAHLLPSGKVLLWERWPTPREPPRSKTYLWDPAGAPSGKLQLVENRFANVFCSGHTFLRDGRLLVAGGHYGCDASGEDTLLFFDSAKQEWTKGPAMNDGRWYPTATMLQDGRVLVVSGRRKNPACKPEPLGGHAAGNDRPDLAQGNTNDLPQVWAGQAGWVDLSSASEDMVDYPWMMLAPPRCVAGRCGGVFRAGPQASTRFLEPSGGGKWTAGPDRPDLTLRDYGSAVMYEPGKILVMGGGGDLGPPPLASAATIDLNADPLAWRATGSMHFRRRQLNATLLPDGKVLVTGGTSSQGFNMGAGAVREAEMWDPKTGTWTLLASMSPEIKRLYHSTALLLPDGRVLSAGGGLPAADDDGKRTYPNAQLFSPPYLRLGPQAPRPGITSAPKALHYGGSFDVEASNAATVKRVTLLRLGSVTHAFDQSQLFAELTIVSRQGNRLAVKGPATAYICPPGPYMLFILSDQGVPSVARIVTVGE